MNKPIFFLHITKTGGQTIEELLRRNYSEVMQFTHDKDYSGLPKNKEVYMGQVANYTSDMLDISFKFSFVRDPIDRLVSFYNYYKLHNHRGAQWIHNDGTVERYEVNSQLPLIEFFGQEGIKKVAFNRMTRDFGSKEPLFSLDPMDEVYDRAIKNIDYYDFIGIFEEFDTSMSKLGKLLGKDFEQLHVNKAKKLKKDITKKEREFLQPFVEYDQKVYDYCLKKFKNG